jgi:hypothetical protein
MGPPSDAPPPPPLAPPPGFAALSRHALAGGPAALSPGAAHSNRLALLAPEGAPPLALFASGRRVFVAAPGGGAAPAPARGKAGVCLPAAGADAAASALLGVALRAEAQDLALAACGGADAAGEESLLAATDAYGRCALARVRRAPRGSAAADYAAEHGGDADAPLLLVAGVAELAPGAAGAEPGWAGAALAPGAPCCAAVARAFARDVTLFDGALPVRTLHTAGRPAAVALLDGAAASGGTAALLAVAEGPTVLVFDARAGERGGRVARLAPRGAHGGALLALAAPPAGGGPPLLAAAGADRAVLVFDARRWALLDRWAGATRRAAVALHFLAADPGACLVAGLDHEAVVGRWAGGGADGGRRPGANCRSGEGDGEEEAGGGGGAAAFRGDARWLGVARAEGRDLAAALSAGGQIYLADVR